MSTVQMKNVAIDVGTVELAAETASALDADARRYAQQTREIREELLHGQEQRRAAWAGQGEEPAEHSMLVAA